MSLFAPFDNFVWVLLYLYCASIVFSPALIIISELLTRPAHHRTCLQRAQEHTSFPGQATGGQLRLSFISPSVKTSSVLKKIEMKDMCVIRQSEVLTLEMRSMEISARTMMKMMRETEPTHCQVHSI